MRLLLASLLASLALGCGSGAGEVDVSTLASSSDEIIWQAGQKAYEKKGWDSARQYFKRIIDGFPQSQYGPAARLALADAYYSEGGTASYILAVAEYRQFLTLFPSHPRADYAQFQAGECYYRQRNSADRDQTSTEQALEEYQRLLDFYPGSSHVETARERITDCRQSLARAEFLAGYFYQKTRQAYTAAITRYEGIISDYPDYSGIDEVLFRLAQCLSFMARKPEALPHLDRMIREFPDSPFAAEARRLEAEIRPR